MATTDCLDDADTNSHMSVGAVEDMELSEGGGHDMVTEMAPSSSLSDEITNTVETQPDEQDQLLVPANITELASSIPDTVNVEQEDSQNIPLSIMVNEQSDDGKEVPTKLWIYPGNIAPPIHKKAMEAVDNISMQNTSNVQIKTSESESTVLFQITTSTSQNNSVDKPASQEGTVTDSTDTVYSCNLCDFVTEHKHNLKTHMLVHTKPTVKEFFQCEECDYVTPLKYNLKTHMKKHANLQDLSENDIFRCKDCDYVSAYKHDLQTHVKKHAPEKQFKCDDCTFSSIYKHSLIHHVASKHKRERPHKCTECSYKSARKQDLLTHMGKHAAEKPFQCQLCEYGTPYKQSFKAHMNRHLGNKMYKCNHVGCGFSTTTAQNLKSHLARHSDVKQHQCRFCDYSASHKTQLTNHEAKHTEAQRKSPRKFTCTICDYETAHKYSLKRHIERHSETREMPEKVFQCEQCGYATGYKISLKRHLAKHSDVKPFKCGHCDYSAINMTQMHVHIAKHTGIKPFKCNQCEYATANKQHLVGHMAKHSDVRYKCPLCEFSTAWKQRLTIHLKQHQLGTLHMSPHPHQTNTQGQPMVQSMMQESVQQLYQIEHSETNEALSQLSNAIAAFHQIHGDIQDGTSQEGVHHAQPEGAGQQSISVIGSSVSSEGIVTSSASNVLINLPSGTQLPQQHRTVMIVGNDDVHQTPQQVQLIEGANTVLGSDLQKIAPPTMQGPASPSTEINMAAVAPVTTVHQGEVFMFSTTGELKEVTQVQMADSEPLVSVAETVIGATSVVGLEPIEVTGAIEQTQVTVPETMTGATSEIEPTVVTAAETVIEATSGMEATVVTEAETVVVTS